MVEGENFEGQSESPGFRTYFAEYGRDRILSLRPKSWRVFFDAIAPDNENPSAIEVRVFWERNWQTKTLTVGETNEDLGEIPLSIAIHRAEDKWLRESLERKGTARPEGKTGPRPIIGKLHYWKKADSGDGVVQDKSGSVTGWIALGPKNYERIMDVLMSGGEPNFAIGITTKMPTEDQLHWDGKEELDIVEAKLVLFHGPESDEDETRELNFEPKPEPPSRDHLELVGRHDTLLAAVQKLLVPLWVIAAAAIVGAVWR